MRGGIKHFCSCSGASRCLFAEIHKNYTHGETVKAFVQLKPDAKVTAEELIAYSREHLAAYKIPRIIEFRSELPRTATGKALRRILRDAEIEIAKSKKSE